MVTRWIPAWHKTRTWRAGGRKHLEGIPAGNARQLAFLTDLARAAASPAPTSPIAAAAAAASAIAPRTAAATAIARAAATTSHHCLAGWNEQACWRPLCRRLYLRVLRNHSCSPETLGIRELEEESCSYALSFPSIDLLSFFIHFSRTSSLPAVYFLKS